MDNAADRSRWYYEVWSVFLALILLGPLAYPLLWKSPKLSLKWKWILTLIFSLLTFVMIVLTWGTFQLLLDILSSQGTFD